MMRLAALSTTAIVLLALPGTGFAATCDLVSDGLSSTLTCGAAGSDPVARAEDNLTIAVTADGSVISANRAIAAVAVGGTDVKVVNAGTISNTDPGNNANAIAATGNRLTVENSGRIFSGDRAIHALSGYLGGLVVNNLEGGVIESRRQTIRTEGNFPGSVVTNSGTISSMTGRALQLRGQGTTVTNHGTITGGEEVIEARDDFTLTNYGTIILRDGVEDEDGVQFASGTVYNYGTIQGSDDGIDIDEGEIFNYASGRIISTGPGGHGIDIDPVFDNSRDAIRPSGTVTIVNAGYIEGPAAIGADVAAANSVIVHNSGTLVARGDYAIAFSPVQGNSLVSLTGGSQVIGGIRFGAGDDVLEIGSVTSGFVFDGLGDGGAGQNTVRFVDYLLTDLFSFSVRDGIAKFGLNTPAGQISAQVINFDLWRFADDRTYATREIAAALSPVPLPAGLPLLMGALAGLAALRRRKG